jgi:hypothetical protein
VLPTSRLFGHITQKGPCESVARFGRFCTERAKKGPNFIKICFLSLILSYSRKVQEILYLSHSQRQRQFKKKKLKITGGHNFSLGYEFFCHTSRKVLPRFGNSGLSVSAKSKFPLSARSSSLAAGVDRCAVLLLNRANDRSVKQKMLAV